MKENSDGKLGVESGDSKCRVEGICNHFLKKSIDFLNCKATHIHCGKIKSLLIFFFFFFFFCFLGLSMAYGGSQARGPCGAIDVGLRHSYRNARSEPRL